MVQSEVAFKTEKLAYGQCHCNSGRQQYLLHQWWNTIFPSPF